MKKGSFFLGVLVGIALAIGGLYVIGMMGEAPADNDPIQYLEQPVSYENKKETSFKVFQVLDDMALADEISDKQFKWYNGNTVVLKGNDFYTDQVVTVKNPQRIGTYSYTSRNNTPMTVPVIEGEMR